MKARQKSRRDDYLVDDEGRAVRVRVVILTRQGERRILGGIAGGIYSVDHFSQARDGGQLMAHVRDGANRWSLGEGDYLLPAAEAPRSPLGVAVGAVLKAWGELEADPMSEAVGFYPDSRPELVRIAEAHGWTLEELAEATAARGVSAKWIYFSGLGALSHDEGRR